MHLKTLKPTYVLEESSGFVVPVVTVTLDSESVVAPGEETCVVGVAANGGGHKKKHRGRNNCHVTSIHSASLDHNFIIEI